MSTTELEIQKASLAREILTSTNEAMISNMWLVLKSFTTVDSRRSETPKRREIGILDGKARIVFHDDWSMTTEELLDLK